MKIELRTSYQSLSLVMDCLTYSEADYALLWGYLAEGTEILRTESGHLRVLRPVAKAATLPTG
jgi:hypothetical protein